MIAKNIYVCMFVRVEHRKICKLLKLIKIFTNFKIAMFSNVQYSAPFIQNLYSSEFFKELNALLQTFKAYISLK